jgi:hypothetical protein
MEFEIFLAAVLVLHARGSGDVRRLHRAFSQHRKLLEHEFELAVGFKQLEHVAHRALAVTAIVIEEFHERDVALRIAERDLAGRAEEGRAVLLDGGFVLLGIGHRLILLEFRHHFLQELGMRHQILLDDLLDLAALICRKGLRPDGSGKDQGQEQCERSGSEGAKVRSHVDFFLG